MKLVHKVMSNLQVLLLDSLLLYRLGVVLLPVNLLVKLEQLVTN